MKLKMPIAKLKPGEKYIGFKPRKKRRKKSTKANKK